MIDYHTHSIYSDGKDTYHEILNQSVKKGLTQIGFSDHFCLYYPAWAVQPKDLKALMNDILDIKQNHDLPIDVKFGLEVDYIESQEEEIRAWLEKFPLDYTIGSVHYVDDWNFDTQDSGYQERNIDSFYKNYFRLLQKAARSGLFDIMGHIDVVKKFNYAPGFDLNPLYAETAKVFSESDVVIELNTSGRDRPCKEYYPSDEFLNYCFINQVPITLGSDAHVATDVGRYFPEVIQKLKQLGYKYLVGFSNRNREWIKI